MEFWSKSGVALDQTTYVMACQGDYYLSCSSTRRGVSTGGGLGGGETEVSVLCMVCVGERNAGGAEPGSWGSKTALLQLPGR